MDILKEYARMCKSFQIRQEDLAVILGGEHTKLFLFFDAVRKGHLKTDEHAAHFLYQQSAQHGAYKQLKSELKKRLVNLMFIADFQAATQLTDLQRVVLKCNKNWAAIQMLTGRSMPNAAIDLASSTLQLALDYELTEVAFNCSRVLTIMYQLRYSKSPKLAIYRATMLDMRKVLLAQYQADEYYNILIQGVVQTSAIQTELYEKAMQYYTELSPYLERFGNFRLHLTARLIQIQGYSTGHKFAEGLEACDEAVAFFEKKPFEMKTQIGIFLNQKAACCLNLKKYDLGIETIIRNRSLLEEGTYNWFNNSLLHVKILLHKGGYRDSWINFQMLKNQPSVAKQNKVTQEEIQILEAYLSYLIYAKAIEPDEETEKSVKRFRLSRFLNEVPTFSKDKRGSYISVLVVQVMWTIIDVNTRDILVERMEALEKYRSRYVRNNENPRTHLFISLVKELIRSDYNPAKLTRRVPKILEKMSLLPAEINPMGQTAEVMPYEAIWGFMLKSLTEPMPPHPITQNLKKVA